MQLSGIELSQTQPITFLRLIEEAGKNLQRVGAFLVDVVARVSANEAFQRTTHEEDALRSLFALVAECGGGVAAAGTADEHLAFVLRVEVDEHIASHETGLHALGTRQSGLFVAREKAFQRSMYKVFAIEDGQFDGTTDTVVGTERGALGAEPFAIDIGLNGIAVEVEVYVDQFLAYHVHMALQDDGLTVFHTRSSWFANEHVARLVDQCLEVVVFAECFQVLNHLLLTLRGARDFVDACELFEHASRF